MAKEVLAKNNGQSDNPISELPDIPTISPQYHDPGFLVGASVDTGNPGSRILSMDKDLPTMLKALDVDGDDESLDFSAALAWCVRWNRKMKNGRGNLDYHIEALKYRLSLKCSIKAKYTHLYGEIANGIITTDTNGKSMSHLMYKENKDGKDDRDNKLFRKN